MGHLATHKLRGDYTSREKQIPRRTRDASSELRVTGRDRKTQ